MKTIPLDQWFSAINAGDPGLIPMLGTMKTIPLDQWFSAINAEDPGLIPVLVWYPGEGIGYPLQYSWGSLVAQLVIAQLVKNPPAMRETWVQSLGGEDPLEKGKATHSSILT